MSEYGEIVSSPPPEIGVLVKLRASSRSSVFVAGPNVTTRELTIPSGAVERWLDTYRPEIQKAAKKQMGKYPPESESKRIYISTKEYCTESWKTMTVQASANPRALLIILRISSTSEAHAWTLAGNPHASTNLLSDVGNDFEKSLWVCGSDGIPIRISSGFNLLILSCCLSRPREGKPVLSEDVEA
jgi:hypothetical protein